MTTKIKETTLWERETKLIFCDICIDQINLGNRPTTHFNKERWQNAIKKFKESTGREYYRMQLKNKWDQLKKDWKIWKDLKRGFTGLGWDPMKRTIDASEEWWAERLKVVPGAKKYKLSGLDPELEDKLDQMFGGVVATGKYACAPSQSGFSEAQEKLAVDISADSTDAPSPEVNEVQLTSRSKRRLIERKKKGGSALLQKQISDLVASNSVEPKIVPAKSIVKILNEDKEIAEDLSLNLYAIDLLRDLTLRKYFISIPEDKKVAFLKYYHHLKDN